MIKISAASMRSRFTQSTNRGSTAIAEIEGVSPADQHILSGLVQVLRRSTASAPFRRAEAPPFLCLAHLFTELSRHDRIASRFRQRRHR